MIGHLGRLTTPSAGCRPVIGHIGRRDHATDRSILAHILRAHPVAVGNTGVAGGRRAFDAWLALGPRRAFGALRCSPGLSLDLTLRLGLRRKLFKSRTTPALTAASALPPELAPILSWISTVLAGLTKLWLTSAVPAWLTNLWLTSPIQPTLLPQVTTLLTLVGGYLTGLIEPKSATIGLAIITPLLSPIASVVAPVLTEAAPVSAPVLAKVAAISAPVLAEIAPVFAPILAEVAPVFAPVLTEIAFVVAPVLTEIAPVVAPVLTETLPVTAPELLVLKALLSPILAVPVLHRKTPPAGLVK